MPYCGGTYRSQRPEDASSSILQMAEKLVTLDLNTDLMMNNIFDRAVRDPSIARLDKLSTNTRPLLGKMNAAQMLAHVNKRYAMLCEPNYGATHERTNALVRFLLKIFLKPIVVRPKPYAKNSRTAPELIVADARVVETERRRLITNMYQVQPWGAKHFEGKDNHSSAVMTAQAWNNLFAKHLDHHLGQFGA